MSNPKPFVTFVRPLGPRTSVSLLVGKGDAELVLDGPASAQSGLDRPEIGVYVAEREADFDRLLADTRRAVDLAGEFTVFPGTPLLVMGWGYEDDEESLKVASFPLSEDLPPPVRQLDQEFMAIAAETTRHRELTLAGVANWGGKTLTADTLQGRLTLRASGDKTVWLHNPAGPPPKDVEDGTDSGLTLILEKDVPQDRLDEEDRCVIPIRRNGVTQLSLPEWTADEPAAAIVSLKPGDAIELSFAIGVHLFLPPGDYRGFVEYESRMGELQDDQAVEGVLRVALGSIRLTASPSERSNQ